MRSIEILGARVSYRIWGEKTGDALLCLHGNPTSSYLWRHVGEGLRDICTVIAPDLPGQGHSELGPRAGTWEDLEQFVEDFAAALGLGPFSLALHDWGGLIGFRWLFDHPHREKNLRRLIISDTGFFPVGNDAWHSLAKIWRTDGEGEAWMDALTFDDFREVMRAANASLSDEAVAEYWKTFSTKERRYSKLALYRSGDFDKIRPYEGRLQALKCPALIIWGENDIFIPAAAAHLFNQQIANSELHVLPDAGHFLWEDAPAATVRLVREFLLSY